MMPTENNFCYILDKWWINIFVFTIIVLWQEERKAADNKIKKLKLHAKAKLTSLNKHIEEMKAQGGTVLSTEPQSEEQLSKV